MTSEPDSNEDRRPPTIELKATEIPDPAAADTGAAPDDATPPPGPEPVEASPRSGGSRLATHALSAIIGAIVALAVGAGLWFGGILPPHAPNAATGAVSTAATETSAPAVGSDLSARLDKIEHAIQAQPTQRALTDRVTAAEAQTKSLQESLAALTRRLDDIAGTSDSAAKQAAAAQSAAQAAKAASDSTSQASQANVQKSDLDALANRVAALESTVKGLADAASRPVASGNDQTARLTVAAEALDAAVARGTPYQPELAAVAALGVQKDVTAPLEPFAASGVPSAAALSHELAGLVPALQRAIESPSDKSTFLGRLEANASRLIRITPAQAPAGNAPSAVVARIAADAAHADVGAAQTDIAALPDSAKPITTDWLEKVKARQTALDASRRIAAEALAALSKPASQ